MAGDRGVLKRRIRAGRGEFPIDCPLNDTTVKLHYRARPHRPGATELEGGGGGGGGGGGWAYDSAAAAGEATAAGAGAGAPLEVDTGCGELPEAVELCARLMVPGELARAVAQPRYAYQVRGWCCGLWWVIRGLTGPVLGFPFKCWSRRGSAVPGGVGPAAQHACRDPRHGGTRRFFATARRPALQLWWVYSSSNQRHNQGPP
jgi:hypothetical protein